MTAWQKDAWKAEHDEKDYALAARAEAIRMRDEIAAYLPKKNGKAFNL